MSTAESAHTASWMNAGMRTCGVALAATQPHRRERAGPIVEVTGLTKKSYRSASPLYAASNHKPRARHIVNLIVPQLRLLNTRGKCMRTLHVLCDFGINKSHPRRVGLLQTAHRPPPRQGEEHETQINLIMSQHPRIPTQ